MKKLDLHRVRHEEARRKVIRFIEDNWGSNKEGEIITGNSPQMKKIVVDILNEYGLGYQFGRPFDAWNNGYIITWFE